MIACIACIGTIEREELSSQFRENHGSNYCFYGTECTTQAHILRPILLTRVILDLKNRYSIPDLVTNDFEPRVMDLFVGSPGSDHHSRVITKTLLFQNMYERRCFLLMCTAWAMPSSKKPAEWYQRT